jgi:hypothetical protein
VGMRYAAEVIYRDGNPQEVARFLSAQDAVAFVQGKRRPEDRTRMAWRVVDTDDPEVNVEALVEDEEVEGWLAQADLPSPGRAHGDDA